MWRTLPLSLKLTLPLIVMQLLVIGVGVSWGVGRLEGLRLGELDATLDSQGDVIEDAVRWHGESATIEIP